MEDDACSCWLIVDSFVVCDVEGKRVCVSDDVVREADSAGVREVDSDSSDGVVISARERWKWI